MTAPTPKPLFPQPHRDRPDEWILSLCTRMVFESWVLSDMAEHDRKEPLKDQLWPRIEPDAEAYWRGIVRMAVVERLSPKAIFDTLGQAQLGPVGRSLLLEEVANEVRVAVQTAELLQRLAEESDELGYSRRGRRVTSHAEMAANADEQPEPDTFMAQFHRVWATAVGGLQYDARPWCDLEITAELAGARGDEEPRARVLANAADLARVQTDPTAYAVELHAAAYKLDAEGTDVDRVRRGYERALEVMPDMGAWWGDLIALHLVGGPGKMWPKELWERFVGQSPDLGTGWMWEGPHGSGPDDNVVALCVRVAHAAIAMNDQEMAQTALDHVDGADHPAMGVLRDWLSALRRGLNHTYDPGLAPDFLNPFRYVARGNR